jgi:tetratricopeptide (TPR) repeat protein
LLNKGFSLGELHNYKEAIDCYDKVLDIDPNNVVALNNKGVSLNGLAKYGEAITCFDKVLVIDPNYDLAWDNKGFSLDKLGQHNEAKKWKTMKQRSITIENDKSRIKCYTAEGKAVYETYIQ